MFDDTTTICPTYEMIKKIYALNIHDNKIQSFISTM